MIIQWAWDKWMEWNLATTDSQPHRHCIPFVHFETVSSICPWDLKSVRPSSSECLPWVFPKLLGWTMLNLIDYNLNLKINMYRDNCPNPIRPRHIGDALWLEVIMFLVLLVSWLPDSEAAIGCGVLLGGGTDRSCFWLCWIQISQIWFEWGSFHCPLKWETQPLWFEFQCGAYPGNQIDTEGQVQRTSCNIWHLLQLICTC